MYTIHDKMSVLMRDEHRALSIINRFELPLGVGEKTIEEVCRENDVDSETFICVMNYAIDLHEHNVSNKYNKLSSTLYDIPTLLRYVKNGHTYFLDFQFPRIRQELLSAISGICGQIPMLILRFFDEYAEEVRKHIEQEIDSEYRQHSTDELHKSAKLTELKSLIIKYYPGQANAELFAALHDICEVEEELMLHRAIEDEMLIPSLKHQPGYKERVKREPEQTDEELSEREKEVLRHVVKGLSNKEIAEALFISVHTVISHRKNITRKLNIHSAAGLTIYAIVNGLADL